MNEPRLFDLPEVPDSTSGASEVIQPSDEPGSRVVRVLPDVAGLDKTFDYIIPARSAGSVAVGSIVQIRLHNRKVEAWIVEVDVGVDPSLVLRSVEAVRSVGPSDDVVSLAHWAAHRWAGKPRSVLRSASPERRVSHWPSKRPATPLPSSASIPASILEVVERVPQTTGVVGIVTPPSMPSSELVAALTQGANALVIVPTVVRARYIAGRLARLGLRAHSFPRAWAEGRSGGVVVGARSSVWAPVAEPLDVVVVLDEHDESLQETRNPTWHARDVAIERARRAGARCVLISPCLSLEARHHSDAVLEMPRKVQRAGWPIVEVVDRREEEPGRSGLFSGAVVSALRESKSAVAVLNRKGRSLMLACQTCGELVRTTDGEHLMVEVDDGLLCPATGESRPKICALCGGTTLRRLRLGVTRAAEELSALVGEPVTEVTQRSDPSQRSRISLGTEAVLHGASSVDVVAFLDFDQELLAPRYRSADQAMALLVRAARMVGARSKGGRIVVQTRSPEHRVLDAAVRSDVSRLVVSELEVRSGLSLPPFAALAEISKAGSGEFMANVAATITDAGDRFGDVVVMGPTEKGNYLLKASSNDVLANLLSSVDRPKERVRVVVDPLRS